MFIFCSNRRLMTRFDEATLSLHLEVALASTSPRLLGELAGSDRVCRLAAIGDVARHLAERLRCFDICYPETGKSLEPQPTLFPDDLGPIA
jgi:hypothetical protein